MPFTPNRFGQKLRGLVDDRQESIPDISVATGITQNRLSSISQGEIEPSGDEVLILADYFKCGFEWLIDDDTPNPDENVHLMFRREGGRLNREDRKSIQEFIFLCRNQAFLENLLNRTPNAQVRRCQSQGKFYKDHGMQCAQQIRQKLDIPPNGIVLDIYQKLRGAGLKVFRLMLGSSSISGLSINHPEAGRCILVNYSEDYFRQCFSAAHECAHVFLDDDNDYNISRDGDWSSSDLKEIRANSFASHFLMPVELLKSRRSSTEWHDSATLLSEARMFRVTVPALLKALLDAKLITKQQREQLHNRRLTDAGREDPELPGTLTQQQRQRRLALLKKGLSPAYLDLCFDSYQQNLISRGKLAECLMTDVHGLAGIGILFNRSLKHE
ncbi:MAG: ImmA/IrrE family metallo-endopeptidase [Nitrospirae bacterium]|nr:ImmA/IrrE family metallo-endopeptidase [Magnetococcales bacterium]